MIFYLRTTVTKQLCICFPQPVWNKIHFLQFKTTMLVNQTTFNFNQKQSITYLIIKLNE